MLWCFPHASCSPSGFVGETFISRASRRLWQARLEKPLAISHFFCCPHAQLHYETLLVILDFWPSYGLACHVQIGSQADLGSLSILPHLGALCKTLVTHYSETCSLYWMNMTPFVLYTWYTSSKCGKKIIKRKDHPMANGRDIKDAREPVVPTPCTPKYLLSPSLSLARRRRSCSSP